ncbi:MAG: hypothetical protein Rsou_0507 [Candidatus Ruthia sp. Asou_11_S2]|nr:hypothetical protein [Candidatus Ruthia sp. Asou_11_S2]
MMDIFALIQAEIVNQGFLAFDEMNHWQDPGLEGMHGFLSEEGLSPEQIANVFSRVSNFKLYDREETPATEEDWFVEQDILWVINPWVTRISDIILSQQAQGVDINEVGVFIPKVRRLNYKRVKLGLVHQKTYWKKPRH